MAAELGCTRVILARELSVREIAAIRKESPLPVEVFVHGALCVAYSGQCLTSEALGGRSANRGECAQACRMPYEIVCDGELVPMGDVQYLLSPQDLAAYDLVPQLIAAGVASLKIEGRLKAPEYVAQITRSYRRAIDEAIAGRGSDFPEEEVRAMEMTFSRGFSHGFLDGNNHKVLVRGDYAKKRGVFLGRGCRRGRRSRPAGPRRPAQARGRSRVRRFGGERSCRAGGRVYEVMKAGRGRLAPTPTRPDGLGAGAAELAFGHRDIDLRGLHIGQRVWKTDDPELSRRVRSTYEGHPHRLVNLSVRMVGARVGEALKIEGSTATGFAVTVEGDAMLAAADHLPATEETLREGVQRLGGTIYRLAEFRAEIGGGPLVPKSLVNQLRREVIAKLDARAASAPPRTLAEGSVLEALRPLIEPVAVSPAAPAISALCRTIEQAEAAVAEGAAAIYLDYSDIKTYCAHIERLKQLDESRPVYLATPRIQKPGEAPIFRFLARLGANGLLVRNAGGLAYCARWDVPFIADFSMNAANELSVAWLLAKGATRVTASYDLSFDQLDDFLGRSIGGLF